MKQQFRRTGWLLATAALLTSGAMATPLFSFDFNNEAEGLSMFTILNANNDDYTWKWAKYTTGEKPYYFAQSHSWQCSDYNDFLTTASAYALETGHAYRLRYQAWAESSVSETEKSQVSAGYSKTADINNVTLLGTHDLTYPNKYLGEEGQWIDEIFEVSENGSYYFTFRAGGQVGTGIDNITLEDVGSPMRPGTATEMTVAPDANDLLKATVTATLPAQTITGGTLSAITKVEISRGGTVVGTVTTGLTPGGSFSWTDNNAPAGDVTYSMTIYNGELQSEPAEASAYVGPLAPAAVTSVSMAPGETPGAYTLIWYAVTKAVNGNDLDPAKVKYNVYRVIDETETLIASDIAETTYTDNFTTTERCRLSYKVVALNGATPGEAGVSNSIRVGNINLPFADSFAGNEMSEDWELEIINGSRNWEVVSTGTQPYCDPQDGDGGMLRYNSYSAQNQHSARIATPQINTSSATNPTVDLWFYHYATTYTDKFKVQIQKDGGEWTDIDNSEIIINAAPEGWTKYTFSLTSAVADSQYFKVGLLSISNYGFNLFVDNIRIYNSCTYDLELVDMTGAATVQAGNNAEYTLKVRNNGANTVAAADFNVAVTIDGEAAVTLDGVEIAAGATAEMPLALPFSALDAAGHTVKAVINYSADEELNNNSAEATVEVRLSENPRVEIAEGTADENGNVTLTWQAPVNSDGYIPTDINQDFANVEAFVPETDAETGEQIIPESIVYDGWTAIDVDKAKVGTRYDFSSSIWNVFAPNNSWAPKPSTGKLLGVMVPRTADNDVPSDDWLISPELNSFETSTFDVTFRALTMDYGGKLEVCYSTTDMNPGSFLSTGEIEMNGGNSSSDWYEYSASVPGTAKYIAIHNISPSTASNLIVIDRIAIASDLAVVAGYNVYEEGTRLNDAIIEGTTYNVPATQVRAGEQQRVFNITAIYDDGESALSDPIYVDISTTISDIVAQLNGVRVIAGGIVAETPVEVYTLDGRKAAAGEGVIRLAPAVYIVRTADKALKVLVR